MGGHYIAKKVQWSGNQNPTWVCASDEYVDFESQTSVLATRAYMLFYEIA